MSRRLKTSLITVGILVGCGLLALVIRIVGATEETLQQEVRVASVSELSDGRLWVKLAPKDESKPLAIEAITRYPGGYAVVKPGDGASLKGKAKPVAVRTLTVSPGTVKRTVLAFGEVNAEHDAKVAVEVAGRVKEVKVALGDAVAEKAPLVILDDEERQISLRRAEAELTRAKAALTRVDRQIKNLTRQLEIATESLKHRATELKRWEDLSARGITGGVTRRDQERTQWRAARADHARIQGLLIASEGSRGEGKAAVDLARAARDQAALAVRRCTVLAPFAGKVAARMVERGDRLPANAVVVRLVSQLNVRLRVHVRETEALLLRKGAPATVTIPRVRFPRPAYTNGSPPPRRRTFAAVVEGVGASADPGSRKVAVDLTASNPLELLRANMFARVVIDAGEVHDALLIPDAAIVSDEAGSYVYRAEGDAVKKVKVELGARQGEGRFVEAGLTGEVELVVEGTALLFDGAPIARLGD